MLRPESPLVQMQRNVTACDADECNTWSRDPEEHGFLELRWPGRVVSFCSPGCALRWLAVYTAATESYDL